MITNDPYLIQCKQQAEDALGWGSSVGWTNEDFENLSDKIADKTQVRLSVSTLKRIWGKVKYDSSPTAATLNALAKFLDYESWRDFQRQHTPAKEEEKVVEAPPVVEFVQAEPVKQKQQPVTLTNRKKKYVPLVALCITVLVALALISFFGKHSPSTPPAPNIPPPDLSTVKFSSRKTTEELPNSVVFDYDASAFHSDNVILQQNWDTARRQNIPPDGRQVTSIYYYPGYFKAKLVVDGEIKKQTNVFIKTTGWKGIIERKPVPIYLNANEIKQHDAMGISATALKDKIGTPVFSGNWVEFTNVRNFDGVDSANFSFDATLRNTSTVEESLCRNIKITILGTETAIIIPLCDKGCIADIGILTGYRYINGKDTDLSAFGSDVQNFQHVSFTLANGRLKIYLNNAQILDTEQPITIGNVVGIRFEFEGAGEVKDVKFTSHNKTAYEEKF